MLDSNRQADLREPAIRDWLEADLKNANSKWRLVAVHHPPFSSGAHHAGEQQTRWLCDLFQRHNVDLVISGHDHNYQRTHPLIFSNSTPGPGQRVIGTVEIHEKGIPYVISGAAGASLHDGSNHPQSYTNIAKNIHSLSVLEVDSARLTLRQIDANGLELDALRLTK